MSTQFGYKKLTKKSALRRRRVKALAAFIRAEMDRREMSQRQFAELCGVSSATLNGYLKGKGIDPTLGTLKKLAKATNVDLVTLIDLAFPGELHLSFPSDVLLLARELTELRESHKAVYNFIVTFLRSQTSANDNK